MEEINLQPIFDLLSYISKSPLFIVIVGGFGVKFYADRKDKKEKLRQQQLKLIEDVAESLHKIFPTLFAEIKEKNTDFKRKEEIDQLLKELFEIRFIVFAKSRAYFKCSNFSTDFEKVLWELSKIIKLLFQCSDELAINKDLSNTARRKIVAIIENIPEEQREIVLKKERNDVYDELYIWTDIVWFQARNMLSDLLSEKIIG